MVSSGTAVAGRFPMVMLLVMAINLLAWGVIIYVVILLIRALRKYLNGGKVSTETKIVRRSLGEVVKGHRVRCGMTQEFVAESLGISRQAVSKWENGTSEPTTSNLLALARLFGVSAEELLRSIKTE